MAVPDGELADLRQRLRATRWPRPLPGVGWTAGTDRTTLQRLVEYWADGYDWRAHEAAINALPHETADLDGGAVHFLHYRSESPAALPIVLTHGWPSSFLELTELAERLAHPSAHGGRAADAFEVIVPSLPGFAFSDQRSVLFPAAGTHDLWQQLMTAHLGYSRYAAHGGDLGAGVTTRLAATHPNSLVGIHLLAAAAPADLDESTLSLAERQYQRQLTAWDRDEGGYQHEQMTRPTTLAYGLSDSPAGLLGWILEKYRAWSDSDLSSSFSDDFILTQASLYWFTNTIATSFRPYYEYRNGPPLRIDRVEVPTALALFPADLSQPPRSWAERTYNLTRYTVMPRGGHFAAHEEPGLLAADITEFFADLR